MTDNHQLVHDLLGHITTIKAAVYETRQLQDLPEEGAGYLDMALERLDQLVKQVEDMRT